MESAPPPINIQTAKIQFSITYDNNPLSNASVMLYQGGTTTGAFSLGDGSGVEVTLAQTDLDLMMRISRSPSEDPKLPLIATESHFGPITGSQSVKILVLLPGQAG